MDLVLYCLGELHEFSTLTSVQRSQIEIMGSDSQVLEVLKRTSMDHIVLQGFLRSGAVICVLQRGGRPFKGTPGLDWRIYGERGEIRMTIEQSSYPHLTSDGIDIEVHDSAQNTLDKIKPETTSRFASPIAEIEKIYEAFAMGEHQPDWREAARRHQLMDKIHKGSNVFCSKDESMSQTTS